VITIQAVLRSHAVRRVYLPLLKAVKGSYQRFTGLWGQVIDHLANGPPRHIRWSELKVNCDIYVSGPEAAGQSIATTHDEALVSQLMEESARADVSEADAELEVELQDKDCEQMAFDDCNARGAVSSSGNVGNGTKGEMVPAVEAVELSLSVTKWLEKADAKYRQLFCRRMEQLADGYRSYALSKRLSHCSHPIYETKLDAGQRILWTKLRRGDSERGRCSILVSPLPVTTVTVELFIT
jgi:hypothetical protein